MKGIPLISSKSLIAELFSDFNITGSDWIGKASRHIARALDLMQIDGYYELSTCDVEVEEYIGLLPCDRKYIVAIMVQNGNQVYKLPLTRQLDLGKDFKDVRLHDSFRGTIQNNYLHLSGCDSGTFKVIYFRTPVCNDGFPMIPDNSFVFEALPYYIIHRLAFSSYKHPVISREEAYAMWEKTSHRAKNDMNFPSLEEMQRFVEMTTSPLYSNILEIASNLNTGNDTYYTDPNVKVATPFRSVDDIQE